MSFLQQKTLHQSGEQVSILIKWLLQPHREQTANHSVLPDYMVDTMADFMATFEEVDEQSNWQELSSPARSKELLLPHFKCNVLVWVSKLSQPQRSETKNAPH